MKFTKATVLSGLLATAVAVPTANSARRDAEQARKVARGQKHSFGPQAGNQESGSWGMASAVASGTAAAAPSDFGGFGGGFGGFGGSAPTGFGASNTGSGSVPSDVASSAQPEFSSVFEASTSVVAPVATSSAVIAPVSSTYSASSAEATSSVIAVIASSSSTVQAVAVSSTTSAATAASTSSVSTTEEVADDEYNVSWAGAILNDGKTVYNGVSATFTVPTPKQPTVGETSADVWTVSSWVGIDGSEDSDDCQGLWQAGVDATIDSSGTLSYDAWYEWYPANTLGMDIDVTAGDVISVNLTYDSFTSGTVTMENLTTGKSSTKTATSTYQLCGLAAEWIMEDLSVDSDTIGLADYGAVTFSDAVAYTASGSVGPAGSLFMDIEDADNQKLTSTDITDTSVVITYV